MPAAPAHLGSPFLELDREAWSRLRDRHPLSLTEEDLERIKGLGAELDLREVEEVYLPLSRLLSFYDEAAESLHDVTSRFLMASQPPARTPFVIGVAGSVAVGKSTTARLLAELLRRWPGTPSVALVTTDGFLYPNAVLEERGLMARKGFPESYDRRALLRFVAEIKAGVDEVRAPMYSHHVYDIVPGEFVTVRRPDVLIVEGLNVLQPPQTRSDGRIGLAVSDFFDFSVYVDAREEHIKRWYVERFLALKHTAFTDPHSFFRRFADLTDDEAVAMALGIWDDINGPNLRDNVATTRGRANLVLQKGLDHSVRKVLLRKL